MYTKTVAVTAAPLPCKRLRDQVREHMRYLHCNLKQVQRHPAPPRHALYADDEAAPKGATAYPKGAVHAHGQKQVHTAQKVP
jgi:hypothetical protein